jgi:hypothetical protein
MICSHHTDGVDRDQCPAPDPHDLAEALYRALRYSRPNRVRQLHARLTECGQTIRTFDASPVIGGGW